jgi:hypothetical protein
VSGQFHASCKAAQGGPAGCPLDKRLKGIKEQVTVLLRNEILAVQSVSKPHLLAEKHTLTYKYNNNENGEI